MKLSILILLFPVLSFQFAKSQDKINNSSTFHGKKNLQPDDHTHHILSLKFAYIHLEKKYYVADLIHQNHPDSLVLLMPAAIVARNKNGDTLFTVEYRRKNLHGKWMSWYIHGHLCDSGRLDKGIPDGEWKTFYPDGSLRYVRHYDAFLLRKIKSDILRENRYSFYEIVSLFKKSPIAAVNHFDAVISFHPHTSQDHHFKFLTDRVKHNSTAHPYYFPPYLESLHHGLYINYYPDGMIRDSGYYKNGLRNGIWEEWVENRKIKKLGLYQNGQKKGTWKYYNDRGKLLVLKEYNAKGKEVYLKKFY